MPITVRSKVPGASVIASEISAVLPCSDTNAWSTPASTSAEASARSERRTALVWSPTPFPLAARATRTQSTRRAFSVGSPPESTIRSPARPASSMAARTAASVAGGRCVETKQNRHAWLQ